MGGDRTMSVTEKITPRPEGPDFVGVGVQKSGTTWIGDALSQHPQIFFSPKKEISFFTRRFHKGYRWYHDIFREKKDRLAGEISVNYLYAPRPNSAHKEYYPNWNPRRQVLFWRKMPSARNQLKYNYPGLKIFAMFRNPVDRAWSHYWFWRSRKERLGKGSVSFERIFAEDGRWIQLQGNFADHLAYWREAFPEMGVFFYDDLVKDPLGLARTVYRFLGVDDTFEPILTRRFKTGNYETMSVETRKWLVDTYRDQIFLFAEMTGRDLSHWLEVG